MESIPLDVRARARLRLRRRERSRRARVPLQQYISVSAGLQEPRHLQALTDLFERVDAGESVRAIITTPPQHGKSVTVLHALVWLLQRDPTKRHAFATYAQQFSRDQTIKAQHLARDRGLDLERDTLDRWNTRDGGSIVWTSRGGPLTGHPVDGVLIVDDLLKDREEANSQIIRDKAHGWLSGVAFTRMHPGASFIMIATRWHLDDPVGRLIEEGGYEVIRLPAITSEGEALWPEQRPLSWLAQQKGRMLAGDWHALYMGEPIEDGSRVFGPSTYYDALPDGPYREAHAIDAAYTKSTSSDWSVMLTGRAYGENLYVTDMLRLRDDPSVFAHRINAAGVTRVHWHGHAVERGLAMYLRERGIRVEFITATADKLARATPAAADWNRGSILIPRRATWAPALESEVSTFTGYDDAHDDIVDTLATLRHALLGGPKPMTPQQRRAVSPW